MPIWIQRLRPSVCAALLLTSGAAAVATARDDGGAADGTEASEWPRLLERNGHQVLVYQPQIDRWHDFRTLSARAAVAVLTRGVDEPEYGALRFTAPTTFDVDERSVQIGRRSLAGSRFPDTDPDRYAEVRDAVDLVLQGNQPIEMSVDEVVAYLELEDEAVPRVIAVLPPPRIIWSREPLLVLAFDGTPRFETVAGTGLMAAVNGSWDVFLDLRAQRYYLLYGDSWITTTDLEHGPWSSAPVLPEGLQRLPSGPEWEAVRSRVPGAPAAIVPRVITGDSDAEIIVTDGPPRPGPIEGSALQVVTNTENDLFFDSTDGRYYLLASGRWFRAASLDGPWTDATRDLPAAFADLPREQFERVLCSVPGTPEAKAAVLLASIPRTATIRREEATLEVAYDGEPNFQPIEGSDGVLAAINTDDDVFMVDGACYCCHEGVWFGAPQPTGPLVVADTVPMAIYTIPWKDPAHRVTYVHVYDSNEETVTVGQTAGYTGELITMGLVIAGLGYAISQADSASVRVRVNAGPINVRGRYRTGGKYDVSRGTYVYGRGSSGRSGASRGRTGGTMSTRRSDPYASWGTAVVPRDPPAGARADGLGGTAGTARARAGLAAGRGADVYAGFDGNVYRRSGEGAWERRGDKSWKTLDAATSRDRQARLDREHQARRWGTTRSRSLGRSRGGRGRR